MGNTNTQSIHESGLVETSNGFYKCTDDQLIEIKSAFMLDYDPTIVDLDHEPSALPTLSELALEQFLDDTVQSTISSIGPSAISSTGSSVSVSVSSSVSQTLGITTRRKGCKHRNKQGCDWCKYCERCYSGGAQGLKRHQASRACRKND